MERFGRYVLLDRIAAGGMAEVYRAAVMGTAGFAKPLAIKRILPHLVTDTDFVNMFIDEAKIASTLIHPNILQVLDLGKEGGAYYIAMEFVAGCSLNMVAAAAVRQGRRLPLEFCCHVVAHALQGLGYAHDKTDTMGKTMGIVHRDVSPQNIMVGYDGSVKLADFGIAKAAERSTQTLTGTIKGKPRYMAPEQVNGGDVDWRLDLYAMGVVLHELITLKRMRKGDTDIQVIKQVSDGTFTRFEDLGLEVPPELARTVYRALEHSVEQRWPDANSFARALEDVSRGQNWHFGATDTAKVLHSLFPAEMEAEKIAQEKFGSQLVELAQGTQELSSASVLEVVDADDVVPTTLTPAPVTLSRRILSSPGAATSAPPPARESPALLRVALGGVVVGALGLVAYAGLGLGRAPVNPVLAYAQLEIDTDPPGATVTLGGQAIAGVTPVKARDLPPGPIEIEARLAGRPNIKKVVMLEAGRNDRLSLTFGVATAAAVKANPPDAAAKPEEVPAAEPKEAAPATAPVVTQKEKRSRSGAKRDPASASTGAVPAAAQPVQEQRSGPAEPGKLSLRSTPWGRLFIDGKDTGRFTPVLDMPLPAGRHDVKLVNDEDSVSDTFSIDIKPGATLKLNRTLK